MNVEEIELELNWMDLIDGWRDLPLLPWITVQLRISLPSFSWTLLWELRWELKWGNGFLCLSFQSFVSCPCGVSLAN